MEFILAFKGPSMVCQSATYVLFCQIGSHSSPGATFQKKAYLTFSLLIL